MYLACPNITDWKFVTADNLSRDLSYTHSISTVWSAGCLVRHCDRLRDPQWQSMYGVQQPPWTVAIVICSAMCWGAE